jgi:N-acetylmuramoyl-L-alanine amidase
LNRWFPAASGLLLALTLASSACRGDSGSGGPIQDPSPEPPGVDAPAAAPSAEPTPDGPRAPVVVLDPGHGGEEVGASNYGVVEKDSNLDMALRVERILVDAGVNVVLTRRDDRRVLAHAGTGAAGTFPATRIDLQARIDLANRERADLFISIHSNGSPDAGQRGVEVWFDPNREFGDRNRALAETLQRSVVAELAAYGYGAVDRGIKDDTCFRSRNGRCFPLFVLGPPRTTTREELVRRGFDPATLGLEPGQDAVTTRATEMPAALVELLFISNAADAAVLADDAGRDAIARGVANAILQSLPAQTVS